MVVATPLENIRQKENLLSNFSCRKKFQKYPLKTNHLNYFLKQDHQNIIFLIKQYLLPKNITSYNQHPLFFASLEDNQLVGSTKWFQVPSSTRLGGLHFGRVDRLQGLGLAGRQVGLGTSRAMSRWCLEIFIIKLAVF